mmetsp:Transcript_32098/g.76289  ORF Transcript_32098/g.76289 Transcript_32098/m.76289 type:complete len:437 (-) Transcript_32098:199-1509(-)
MEATLANVLGRATPEEQLLALRGAGVQDRAYERFAGNFLNPCGTESASGQTLEAEWNRRITGVRASLSARKNFLRRQFEFSSHPLACSDPAGGGRRPALSYMGPSADNHLFPPPWISSADKGIYSSFSVPDGKRKSTPTQTQDNGCSGSDSGSAGDIHGSRPAKVPRACWVRQTTQTPSPVVPQAFPGLSASHGTGSGGFRGVARCLDGKKFVAYVSILGATNLVGSYDTEVEAAAVYDQVMLSLLGSFAVPHLNFPAESLQAVGGRTSPANMGLVLGGGAACVPTSDTEGCVRRDMYSRFAGGSPQSQSAHTEVTAMAAPPPSESRDRRASSPPSFKKASGADPNTAEGSQKSSRFRGVSWNKKDRKWQAMIFARGRAMWLGYFKEEAEAAKAYDMAALRVRGRKAKLNFPVETYPNAEEMMELADADCRTGVTG